MKKLFFILPVLICNTTNAYSNFKPYIGIDAGLNIADYNIETELNDMYYSATINAGARIGKNFGVELYFTHSSTNDIRYIQTFDLNHEVYYMAYGFDIFAYYNINRDFDFFTSFGVGNYKIYNKIEYIDINNDLTIKESENNVTTRLGIGVMYTFPGDDTSLLLQYQYIPVNDELFHTMSEFSIGARYIF